MHQDYPYIMQSPEQITSYINLGKLQPIWKWGYKSLAWQSQGRSDSFKQGKSDDGSSYY